MAYTVSLPRGTSPSEAGVPNRPRGRGQGESVRPSRMSSERPVRESRVEDLAAEEPLEVDLERLSDVETTEAFVAREDSDDVLGEDEPFVVKATPLPSHYEPKVHYEKKWCLMIRPPVRPTGTMGTLSGDEAGWETCDRFFHPSPIGALEPMVRDLYFRTYEKEIEARGTKQVVWGRERLDSILGGYEYATEESRSFKMFKAVLRAAYQLPEEYQWRFAKPGEKIYHRLGQ